MMRSPSFARALAVSSPTRRWSRSIMCLTAAASLSSSASASAFVSVGRTTAHPGIVVPHHHQHRLYGSKNKDGQGFLGKAAEGVKSILPKKWFQSEEEKKTEIQRKRVRDEVSGGLAEMLKDAPLPIRMVGRVMGPLVSGMVSSMAETMGEQQRQMDDLLEDARSFIVRDDAAASALGEPIIVQAPFSQSSSTSNINGKTNSQLQASFTVQGSVGTGVAIMSATGSGISSLVVQVGGRNINVNLSKGGPPQGGYKQSLGRNRMNNDDIIDVEFVEKK